MNFRLLSSIIILVMVMILGGVVRPAEALIDTHECAFCHDFHGAISNSGLLKYSSTEVLCLSCHSTVEGSTDAAAVHNPQGLASNQQGYITCRECHNPHDNIDGNIKLVGYKFDPVSLQKFTSPKIREELTTSDPGNPVYKDVVFATQTEPADYYRNDGKGICEICHTSNHLVGKDCISCHNHKNDFGGTVDPPEGFPPVSEDCTYCHTGTGTDDGGLYSYDAYKVGPSSKHVKITGGGSFNACTDCHPSHSGIPDVVIPNNPPVGIFYTANGESGIGLGGTQTSGTSEAEICWNCHGGGQSEWNGQAYNGYSVSTENWSTAEFDAPNGEGNSTDVIPTRPTRSMHTANDVDSPDAGLSEILDDVRSSSVADNVTSGVLDGTLSDRSSITLEKVKYIRCSYCHDVHDTVVGSPSKGDTITAENGQVFSLTYLRGTWLPNPYNGKTVTGAANAPEVPPWDQGSRADNSTYYSSDGSTNAAGVTRTTTSVSVGSSTHNNWGHRGTTDNDTGLETYVNLPRLWTTSPGSNRQGGFFIDQNTGWPTRTSGDGSAGSPYTFSGVSETAGLCTLCHDEGTDNLDYYTDSATLWRGSNNGHSNSVLGGSGYTSGNDLFSGRRDLGGTAEWGMQGQPAPDSSDGEDNSWADDSGNPGFSDKPNNVLPFGKGFEDENNWQPGRQDSQNGYIGVFNTGWYGANPGGKERTSSGDYTKWFTKSATDNIGIWGGGSGSDRAHNFSCSKCHTPHASGLPALLITNCLDTDVATWYADGVALDSGDTIVRVGPTSTNTWARRSAGNCHRKEYWNSAANNRDNTGWIKLAPGQ